MEKYAETKFVKFVLKMSWLQFILLWTLAIPVGASLVKFIFLLLLSPLSYTPFLIFIGFISLFCGLIGVVYGLLWLAALIIRLVVTLKDNTPKRS